MTVSKRKNPCDDCAVSLLCVTESLRKIFRCQKCNDIIALQHDSEVNIRLGQYKGDAHIKFRKCQRFIAKTPEDQQRFRFCKECLVEYVKRMGAPLETR